MTLSAAKVQTQILIPQLNYNKMGNLSSLMARTGTSSMLLPKHWELVLKATRHLVQHIIDIKGDQR